MPALPTPESSMMTALSLLFAASLSTTAVADAGACEIDVCQSGWMGLSSCEGGMILGSMWMAGTGEEACLDVLDDVLSAHDRYTATPDDINAPAAQSVVDYLGSCMDQGHLSCRELGVLASETGDLIDNLHECDADAEDVLSELEMSARVAWREQCMDTDRFDASMWILGEG